jgi:hypothetical protein
VTRPPLDIVSRFSLRANHHGSITRSGDCSGREHRDPEPNSLASNLRWESAPSGDLASRVSGQYIFLGGTYWTGEHTRRILLPFSTYLSVQLRAIS